MKQEAWRRWESLRSGPRHVSKRRVDLRAPYPPRTPRLCYKTIASGTHSQTPCTLSSTRIPQHPISEGHRVIVLYDPRNDQAVALHLGLGFKSIRYHKEWVSYLNWEVWSSSRVQNYIPQSCHSALQFAIGGDNLHQSSHVVYPQECLYALVFTSWSLWHVNNLR
jgi:hypothetical protein